MFDSDLLIAFGLMSILFLRQISILKQPNKINYIPLVLGIGTISSIIHFMIHTDTGDVLLLLRESLFPLLVAIILYLIMNIFHQTQKTTEVKTDNELKLFVVELENKMMAMQQESIKTQEEIRRKFIEDIQILNTIESNQKKFESNQNLFIEKFQQVQEWHNDVKNSFKYFTQEQLPKLDDVVHKHIDILRISEKDHYNKLQELLKKAVESRFGISDDIRDVHIKLDKLNDIAKTISNDIVRETTSEFMNIVKDFEKEMLLLKSNAALLNTSLHEGENILLSIRTHSELIVKQMVLSSKKMDELGEKSIEFGDIFKDVEFLFDEIKTIKEEYVKAEIELGFLTKDMKKDREEELNLVVEKFDKLAKELSEKIDVSLENLHKHYHTVGEEITTKANLLAKQAQIKNGYLEFEE